MQEEPHLAVPLICSCCSGLKKGFFLSTDFVVTDLTVNLIFTNVLSYNSELLANHLSCSTQN